MKFRTIALATAFAMSSTFGFTQAGGASVGAARSTEGAAGDMVKKVHARAALACRSNRLL